jgi:hypothetical protein
MTVSMGFFGGPQKRRTTPVVLISHAFNEEYLMKAWLRHHVPMFDHGVILDYASTDRTVEICRELAPNWEVRPSRNPDFGAHACDREVMDVEAEFDGAWKIALNTTEFLCGDLTNLVCNLEGNNIDAARIRPVVLVDPLDAPERDPNGPIPLVRQCHYGFTYGVDLPDGLQVGSRSRLLHRHRDGAYTTGRHGSAHPGIYEYPPGALLLWMAFAPWNEHILARKLQIKDRIPDGDKAANLGVQHYMDAEQLDRVRREQAAFSRDLYTIPEYAEVMGTLP